MENSNESLAKIPSTLPKIGITSFLMVLTGVILFGGSVAMLPILRFISTSSFIQRVNLDEDAVIVVSALLFFMVGFLLSPFIVFSGIVLSGVSLFRERNKIFGILGLIFGIVSLCALGLLVLMGA